MVSRYYACIKLDVHYQRFLRHQFGCENEVFEFPNRHKFNTMLEHFVTALPEGYEEPDYGAETFKIAIPFMEYKNVASYRHLSCVKETIFKQKIREFYNWVIEDRIKSLMKNTEKTEDGGMIRLDRQECTLLLIDEYDFDRGNCDSFDRLYKFITRYKKNEINRRYFSKKKQISRIKSDCTN
jgi:hypothetical protein